MARSKPLSLLPMCSARTVYKHWSFFEHRHWMAWLTHTHTHTHTLTHTHTPLWASDTHHSGPQTHTPLWASHTHTHTHTHTHKHPHTTNAPAHTTLSLCI